MPTTPVMVTGFALVAGLALTGCGRQVAVEPPQQPPAICSDLIDTLPETVDGAGRRPTTPASPATAAWGEPPIVVRCGVAQPAALTSTSVLLEVNGIGWLPEPLAAGTLFTAVEFPDSEPRQASVLPFVEVAIPQEYQSPGGILSDISAAITTDRGGED